MIKQLIFHLGDPKTGSTSIQDTLATGNWICDTRSLMYPTAINHIPLAMSLVEKNGQVKQNRQFRGLARRLNESSADVAVVSAEFFENVPPAVLAAALKKYLPEHAKSARFIAYVRPHADRLVSAFAERVKAGYFSGTLEELYAVTLEKRRFFYHERFARWRDTFGDRFKLRPMIRSELFRRDVVSDFFQYALDGEPFELVETPASNESLSVQDLAVLRELHIRMRKDTDKLIKAHIATGLNFSRILSSMPSSENHTPMRIHKSLVPQVLDTYGKDAQMLDTDFFDGTPMSDALNAVTSKAVEKPLSLAAKDHFSDDQMVTINRWCEMVANLVGFRPGKLPDKLRQMQKESLRLTSERLNELKPATE